MAEARCWLCIAVEVFKFLDDGWEFYSQVATHVFKIHNWYEKEAAYTPNPLKQTYLWVKSKEI